MNFIIKALIFTSKLKYFKIHTLFFLEHCLKNVVFLSLSPQKTSDCIFNLKVLDHKIIFLNYRTQKKLQSSQPDFYLFQLIANGLKRKENLKKLSFTYIKCEHHAKWELKKKFWIKTNFVYTFLCHLQPFKRKKIPVTETGNSDSGNRKNSGLDKRIFFFSAVFYTFSNFLLNHVINFF